MLKSLLIHRRAAPKVPTDIIFTPSSLDLDPGESGTVAAQVIDQNGNPMNPTTIVLASTAAAIQAAMPGATVTANGANLTIVAPTAGPASDVDVNPKIETIP